MPVIGVGLGAEVWLAVAAGVSVVAAADDVGPEGAETEQPATNRATNTAAEGLAARSPIGPITWRARSEW
jgi:hypothetical protein